MFVEWMCDDGGTQNWQHWIFFLIEVKFTWHEINRFKINASVAFNAFTMLCNHHLYLVPERFHQPQRISVFINGHSPSFSPSPRQRHSASTALPVLNVSCTWNQTVWGLLCLASLIQRNVSKVHVRCSMNWGYFLFHGWVLVTRRDRSHCVYPLIIWGPVGLFPPLGYHRWYCCEYGSTYNCLPMSSALWGPYPEVAIWKLRI